MKSRADLLDRMIGTVWPGPIGQQRDRELTIGVDPEGGARVTEVSK